MKCNWRAWRTCLAATLSVSLLVLGCGKSDDNPKRPRRGDKDDAAEAKAPDGSSTKPSKRQDPQPTRRDSSGGPGGTLVGVRAAAARAQSQNNLKQLALAIYNYETTHGSLPAHAVYGQNGKPLLSWRVAMLPYVEQENLYRQFRLNEPWDSPHNKTLLSRMPRVFALPQTDDQANGTTHYQVFVGPGAIFEPARAGRPNPLRIIQITDGVSNTILVAEAANAVPWTKPEDIDYPVNSTAVLSGYFGGTANVALADMSVHRIPLTTPLANFRAMITRAGGEVVRLP